MATLRAQRISAVKTDKVLPTLGAGGKAVFTPVTGGVEMTSLGDASIGAENALAAQRQASAAASTSRAQTYAGAQAAKQAGTAQAGIAKALANIRQIEHELGRPLTDQETADYLQTGELHVGPEAVGGGAGAGSLGDVAPTVKDGFVSFDDSIPESAKAKLAEGKKTTFGNGQVWTLVRGQPTRVK